MPVIVSGRFQLLRASTRAAAAPSSNKTVCQTASGKPHQQQLRNAGRLARAAAAAPTTAPATRRRLAQRCRAVADEDIIDVEGKLIDDRVPVTVITGFLGSGKTTLLNSILQQDHGYRIAVIENEFGEIDIDSDLVSIEESLDPSKENIMMLNNGCLCCTVRDDLVKMLNELYDRRSQFDRIVIETTGLAQPAPIIQTFFLEPSVADRMKLDGVVTLVDAKHVELHLNEQKADGIVNEAMEQIAYADRVILNKTDLVDAADLQRLEERIRGINSMAQVKRAQRAEVPLDYVLGVGGFDLEKVEEEVMEAKHADEHSHSHNNHSHSHDASSSSSEGSHDCSGADCKDASHSHSHDHDHKHEHGTAEAEAAHSHSHDHDHAGHSHHHHKHDDAVGSVSISVDGDMDLDKVNYFLSALIELKSNDLYRMKGVLAIQDFDKRFVFQGVHMLFEGMPDREWKEGEKRVSKMVFIGKDLDEEIIREGFEECLVPAK